MLTTENTGYPAPLTCGAGMFYTKRYIAEQIRQLRDSDGQREEDKVERPKMHSRSRKPAKKVPKIEKECRFCHQMYLSDGRGTLHRAPDCVDAARIETNRKYHQRRQERKKNSNDSRNLSKRDQRPQGQPVPATL